MDTINNKHGDKDRLRIIHLARELPGYIDKEGIHIGSFILQIKFHSLHTTQIQFVFYRHSSATSGLHPDVASICLALILNNIN